MKMVEGLVAALVSVLGLIIVVPALTGGQLRADEFWSAVTMKPRMAASFDVGTKHLVSYFLSENGMCKLTLMIAERPRGEDEAQVADTSRLRVSIEAGKAAYLDTTEGKPLQFSCRLDGQAMTSEAVDRVTF